MNLKVSKSILSFVAGVGAASVFWMFLRPWSPQDSPIAVPRHANGPSDAPKEKVVDLVTTKGMLRVDESEAVVATELRKARWIDAINGITAEGRRARAQREVTRVTLSRIQRHLAAAPVRPEDMVRLFDLLSYKLNLNYEFSRKSRMSGLPIKGSEYERRLALEEARLDAEIKALVGDSYFSEMASSFGKLDGRLYGWEFIGEALAQGEPLTSEQRKKLDEVISRLDPHIVRGKGESAPDPDTGLTSYDSEVAKALEGILSPQQIRVFKEVRADWNLFYEARRIHGAAKKK